MLVYIEYTRVCTFCAGFKTYKVWTFCTILQSLYEIWVFCTEFEMYKSNHHCEKTYKTRTVPNVHDKLVCINDNPVTEYSLKLFPLFSSFWSWYQWPFTRDCDSWRTPLQSSFSQGWLLFDFFSFCNTVVQLFPLVCPPTDCPLMKILVKLQLFLTLFCSKMLKSHIFSFIFVLISFFMSKYIR